MSTDGTIDTISGDMLDDTLPDKPSELLLAALEDLAKCEVSPDYAIDMSMWHMPVEGKCRVCLAGALLAQRLRVSPTVAVGRAGDKGGVSDKLFAIDALRVGNVWQGLTHLGIDAPQALPAYIDVVRYDRSDPIPFHEYIMRLVDMLQQVGL